MMFVSIEGHAIFQTAERSGPSTIDRSYRPVTGDGATGDSDGVSRTGGAVIPVNSLARCSSLDAPCRILLYEICNAIKDVRVLIHLVFQWRILFRDGSKETCGITQQLGGQLSMRWH